MYLRKLKQELSLFDGDIQEKYPLSKITTFKIGGVCDYLLRPKTTDAFKGAISFCIKNDINYLVTGAFSNILASDKGFEGVIISTLRMNNFCLDGEIIKAEAGAMLGTLSGFCAQNGLKGLEFGIGIPGSIGGATVMNAGAFGGQISDVVLSVRVFDGTEEKIFKKEDLLFNYRSSVFTNSKKYVILEVYLKPTPAKKEEVLETTNQIIFKRRGMQTVLFPSAGSVFKRGNIPPALLIEQAGLKGLSIGGAQVSTVHSGYIVNLGNAKCEDVKTLIGVLKDVIKVRFGVDLELEIILI